ncbi:SH3 domain-containing protein [Falsigemmobacter intermedius]|nr:SH3 domain-containing protein [Falsigemmobacter intermedius]
MMRLTLIALTLASLATLSLLPHGAAFSQEAPAAEEEESSSGTAGEGPAPAAAAPVARSGSKDCPPGIGCVTRRPLPRYVSLKGAEARARRGPASDHRVDWIYQRQGLPLKVTAEYENWRRVEDSEGAGGWMHFALLSNNRSAMIMAEMADIYDAPGGHGSLTARAQQRAVVRLLECQPDWCRISAEGIRGWVKKSDIWGVEPGEVFE